MGMVRSSSICTAIAVQILLLRSIPIDGSLPLLTQMRKSVTPAIAGSAQGIGQRATATGAIARGRLCPLVASPGQAILFVITEILRLAAS